MYPCMDATRAVNHDAALLVACLAVDVPPVTKECCPKTSHGFAVVPAPPWFSRPILAFAFYGPYLPYVVRPPHYRMSLMPGEAYISNCRCPFLSKYSIAEKSFLSRRIFLSNSRLPIEVSTYYRFSKKISGILILPCKLLEMFPRLLCAR